MTDTKELGNKDQKLCSENERYESCKFTVEGFYWNGPRLDFLVNPYTYQRLYTRCISQGEVFTETHPCTHCNMLN